MNATATEPPTVRLSKGAPGAFLPLILCAATAFAGEPPRPAPTGEAKDLQPLALELPPPTLRGTPRDLPSAPEIEPLSEKPRPPFLVPKGVVNVARGKTVTSSAKPFIGQLPQVTDGKKAPDDSDAMEMKRGTQYVQVDLAEEYAISAIVIWHDHRFIQVMRDVIVQVSSDPEFQDAKTLFNNDTDNSSGLGLGTDREYFENYEGKIVDAKGAKARYVRSYLRGSMLSPLNTWQEIEVYALPVK